MSSMVPGGRAAGPHGTGWWVSSSLQQPPGAQGPPRRHRPVLPRWLSARGMTRLLTSRRVLGATRRGSAGPSSGRRAPTGVGGGERW